MKQMELHTSERDSAGVTTPMPDSSSPARRWHWLSFIVGVATGLAILIAAWSVVHATTPTTFTARGSIELTDPNAVNASGSTCEGATTFADVTLGTTVTIYDATGKIVGVSELAQGQRLGSAIVSCLFAFQISDVPAGVGPYQIQLGHRGSRVVKAEDNLQSGVALTI